MRLFKREPEPPKRWRVVNRPKGSGRYFLISPNGRAMQSGDVHHLTRLARGLNEKDEVTELVQAGKL